MRDDDSGIPTTYRAVVSTGATTRLQRCWWSARVSGWRSSAVTGWIGTHCGRLTVGDLGGKLVSRNDDEYAGCR